MPAADRDHDVVAGQTEAGEARGTASRSSPATCAPRPWPMHEHLGGHARVDVERDAGLGDDRGTRRASTAAAPASSWRAPCADEHVVAAVAERHSNGDHRSTASTTSLGTAVVDRARWRRPPLRYSALALVVHALQRTGRIVVQQRTVAADWRTRSTSTCGLAHNHTTLALGSCAARSRFSLAQHHAAGGGDDGRLRRCRARRASARSRRPRNASSPSSAKISRTVRPVRASITASLSTSLPAEAFSGDARRRSSCPTHQPDEHQVLICRDAHG